jgi:hypothetical protein
MLANISKFNNTHDYLPIISGAIITDLIVIFRLNTGGIQSNVLKEWYNKYGLSGVLSDVCSIAIGVIITRAVYSYFVKDYSIFTFILLAIVIQITHDLLFMKLFQNIPRGASRIMDTFKDYANELGAVILLADASMIVSTILLASILASFNQNTNIIVFIVSLYLIPYFLCSVKK